MQCISRFFSSLPQPAPAQTFAHALRRALSFGLALCLAGVLLAGQAQAASPQGKGSAGERQEEIVEGSAFLAKDLGPGILLAENKDYDDPDVLNPKTAEQDGEQGAPPANPGQTSQGTGTAEQASSPLLEQLFRGSFLGALFFGYPYESPGVPDMFILGALTLLLLRGVIFRGGQPRPPRSDDDGKNGDSRGRREFRDDLRNTSRDSKDKNSKETEGKGEGFSWEAWSRDKKSPPRQKDQDGPARPDDRNATNNGREDQRQGDGGTQRRDTMEWRARATWDSLRSQAPKPAEGAVESGASVPGGFDVDDFLNGARTLYVRLQNSWAARDLDDLTPFVTSPMMRILREQAALDPTPGQVQILLVTATLAGIVREGDSERASVTFDALMHEGPESDTAEPANIRELWRFLRSSGTGGTWRLDGIEQVPS